MISRRHAPLAIIALLWIARYWASFGLHLWSPPRWQGWFDQDRYVASAIAFARGDLSAAAHWYPPAYALLAAPFVQVTPGDPFFLPDLLLYLTACCGFARAMRPLGLSRTTALTVFVLTTLIDDPTASHWLIPWNTILSSALSWWLIALAIDAIVSAGGPPPRPTRLIALGIVVMLLPAVRLIEAVTVAVTLAVVFLVLLIQRRLRVTGVAAVALGGVAALLPFAALHLAIYGPVPSRYTIEAARQGFALADLPWKAEVLLVSARPWFPDTLAMTERLPWLLIGAAGLLVGAVRMRGAARLTLLLIAAVALPYLALFLSYTDLQPPGLWEFGNAHYFTWLFPLAGTGCWLWLRALRDPRTRVMAAGMLAAVVLATLVRPLPVRVDDTTPARLLTFRGATDRRWADAYFARASIVDSAGTMRNVTQFHQIPDTEGERAVAIVRPFAARPRRYDPGEPRRFAADEPPVARYAERWSIAPPCWLTRSQCTLPR